MLTPKPIEELSPIARCLQIAAARGRARRLARERVAAEQQQREEQAPSNTTNDEVKQ